MRPDGDDDAGEFFSQVGNVPNRRRGADLAAPRAHVVGRGFREQLGEVHARQQQVARTRRTGNGVPQHRGEHLRRGLFGWRIQRRNAERAPDVVPEYAVLAVLQQQRKYQRSMLLQRRTFDTQRQPCVAY